jgi:hypothetical protein
MPHGLPVILVLLVIKEKGEKTAKLPKKPGN